MRPGGHSMFGSQPFKRLLRDNRGATAIEYGLIAAMIAMALIVGMNSVATSSRNMWAFVTSNVSTVM